MQAGPVRQPVGRDRFGNPIFGDRCEDHWANCAYDPYRNNPQISQAPDTNR
jgi:hypothetical protein